MPYEALAFCSLCGGLTIGTARSGGRDWRRPHALSGKRVERMRGRLVSWRYFLGWAAYNRARPAEKGAHTLRPERRGNLRIHTPHHTPDRERVVRVDRPRRSPHRP